MMKKKLYLHWSTGKDAAFTLWTLLNDPQYSDQYSVDLLLTSVNSHHNRVSMHGLHRSMMEAQVECLTKRTTTKTISSKGDDADEASSSSLTSIPLRTIELPEQPSMEEYDSIMLETVTELREKLGFAHTATGDIFLEDLKKYREEQLAKVGIQLVCPIWQAPPLSSSFKGEDASGGGEGKSFDPRAATKALLLKMVAVGFKAVVVCIDGSKLDKSFCGRIIEADGGRSSDASGAEKENTDDDKEKSDHDSGDVKCSFLDDLPAHIDPCGENGEFHTFVFDGPIFERPVRFKLGEIVYREYKPSSKEDDENDDKGSSSSSQQQNKKTVPSSGFYFQDVVPVSAPKK